MSSTVTNNQASDIFDRRILNKFTSLLPTKYKIFAYRKLEENGESVIFYISETLIDVEKESAIDTSVGFISFYIDYLDKDLTVLFVKTNPSFLGNGIGTFLMILAGCYTNSLKDKEITTVKLDDDSDNSWNLEKNIYIKLGLSYVNDEPEPEMEGKLSSLISKWGEYKAKYQDKIRSMR